MTDEQNRERPAGETAPPHHLSDELETLSIAELRSLVRQLRGYTEDLERETSLLRRQVRADLSPSNSSASFVRTANDAIIHLDFEGVITEWNPAAQRLYGYTREEIIGESSDIIVSPEQRQGRNRRIKKVVVGEHIEPYQTARRTKDGKRIEVEVMMSLVRDPTGEPTCISTIERDLSERRRIRKLKEKLIADEAAAESAVNIVNAMREAVMLLTFDGVVVAGNPALERLVGVKVHELIGKNLREFLSNTMTEEAIAGLAGTLKRIRKDKIAELRSVNVTRSDGDTLHVAPMIALVQPPSGKPMRALLVLRDITSIRRYQDNLRALSDRLLANEEEQRIRISRYIHDMIIQNLSLSRIQLGTVEHTLASHSLSGEADTVHSVRSLVDETIDQCRSVMCDLAPPLLHEVGLVPALNELVDKLRTHSEADIRIIDEGLTDTIEAQLLSLLFQITRELIMNALKHAGECNVEVLVGGGDGMVRIQVRDDGRGFDVPAAESQSEHRLSFGLFNIRERITGLGGRLVIHSRPGEGTTATVTLPLTTSGEPDPDPGADTP